MYLKKYLQRRHLDENFELQTSMKSEVEGGVLYSTPGIPTILMCKSSFQDRCARVPPGENKRRG